MTGPVHFFHLGGDLCWQHWRAIHTAEVHGTDRLLWSVEPTLIFEKMGRELERRAAEGMEGFDLTIMALDLEPWLRDHPVKLANVKDLFLWDKLYHYGGIGLDLDTISFRSAWDLIEADVCVGREYHPNDTHPDPYNAAAVIGRRHAKVLWLMRQACLKLLKAGIAQWGALGPRLLTQYVDLHPEAFNIAPYRSLNGWSYHQIDDYYSDPRDPGEPCRVMHLYSSDNLDKFYADRWMP